MSNKEELQSELWERFNLVGRELALNLADYLSDEKNKQSLEKMKLGGCSVIIRVKVTDEIELPDTDISFWGAAFDEVKGKYLDLVLPVEMGKGFFVNL